MPSDVPCARQSVGYALDQTVKRSSVAALVSRPTCFLCAQQAILAGRNLVDGSARLVKVETTPVVGHTLALAGLAGCEDRTSSRGLERDATNDDEQQNWRERHRGGTELDWREFEHCPRLEKDQLLESQTRLAEICFLAAQLSLLYSVSKDSLVALQQLERNAKRMPVAFQMCTVDSVSPSNWCS